MAERVRCEFRLVRYVPDPVRGEYANIGVLLAEAGRPETTQVHLTRDWKRVRCLHADADVAMLEAMEAELGARARNPEDLRRLEESLSNAVQMAPAEGALADSLPELMQRLLRLYVEPPRGGRERRERGRTAIAGAMRREFERAGVWALMRKGIAAERYTGPGDALRIDCGYRPNGVVRLFQAVAVDGELDVVKGLAFSAGPLREGMQRVEGAELHLTAVIEPRERLLAMEERYSFAVRLLEREQIRVMTTADLPRMAETARRELRV